MLYTYQHTSVISASTRYNLRNTSDSLLIYKASAKSMPTDHTVPPIDRRTYVTSSIEGTEAFPKGRYLGKHDYPVRFFDGSSAITA